MQREPIFLSKENIFASVFIILYSFWVFYTHITSSQYFTLFDYESTSKVINSIILVLFLVSLILVYRVSIYSILDFIIIITFVISYLHSKTGLMLFAFTFLARHVRFSLVVKSFLCATLIGIIFVFLTYLFNLYSDSYLDLARNDTYRYLLGYRFPTFLPNYFFHISLCYLFIRKERITFSEIFVLALINYALYVYTDTRAVFYLINLLLFIILIIKWFGVDYKTVILGRLLKLFTINSFFIFGILAIYLQYKYDPNVLWLKNINSALSGRLSLGHQGIEQYGITLFGSFIEYVPILDADKFNTFFYIDSAYLQLLLTNGILMYVLVLIGYQRLGKIIKTKNDPYFGVVIIFLLFHSMTDPQLLAGEFNPFMLCIAYYGTANIKENLLK